MTRNAVNFTPRPPFRSPEIRQPRVPDRIPETVANRYRVRDEK